MMGDPSWAGQADRMLEGLIKTMLERARWRVSREYPVYAAPALADALWAQMSDGERAICDPAACNWLPERRLPNPSDQAMAARWPASGRSSASGLVLDREACSIDAFLTPGQALTLQEACGCEIAADLVYHPATRTLSCMTTRGCRGGVMSDTRFYLALSGRFVVIPIYHTHPSCRNDRGHQVPSAADYLVMQGLRRLLLGHPVGERVVFPDQTWTAYGYTAAGLGFLHRQRARVCWIFADPAVTTSGNGQ